MAIAEVTSPGEFVSESGLTLTSTSFTPPAGSLVVVLHAWGYTNNPTTDPTVTCTSSDGGTWTKVRQVLNLGGWHGEFSFWARYYATSPGSITVTTEITSSVVDGDAHFMDIRVLTGAADTQSGGGNAQVIVSTPTTGTLTLTASLTPTVVGSWVYGIGNYTGATSGDIPASASGNTSINENFFSGIVHRQMSNRRTSATSGSAVTCGWTVGGSASKYGQAVFLEILPAVEKVGTDAGTFTDTASLTVQPATETGTFTDTASVIIQATDSGEFTESASAGEFVFVSDTGVFTDTATVSVGTIIEVSDSIELTDNAIAGIAAVGTDTGTFTDDAQVIIHASETVEVREAAALLDDGYLVAKRVTIIPADNRVVRVEPENRAMTATAVVDGDGLIPSGSYIIPDDGAEPPPDGEDDIITTDGTVIDDTGWLL